MMKLTRLFAVVFLAAWIMSRIEHRSAGEYGLPLNANFGKRLWQGSVLGIVEIIALMGCIGAFGGYSFGSLYIHGAAIFKWGLYWGLFFMVVGFFEEFTFRGYLQFTLADGIGFWPAGWILSLGFGGVHLMNKGEGWVGAASVATIRELMSRKDARIRVVAQSSNRGLAATRNIAVPTPAFRHSRAMPHPYPIALAARSTISHNSKFEPDASTS